MAKTPSNSPFPNFFDFDVTKYFGQFKLPGVDMESLVTAQRKNIEAITAANRLAFEGLQAIAKRQTEIVQKTVAELTTAAKDMATVGSPQDKVARQAELTKEAFEHALANVREIAEMVARSNSETLEVINKRISESLDEVRNLIRSRTGS